MKSEKNKQVHNPKKSKSGKKRVFESSKHDSETTNLTNKRFKKRKNEKLFKEEQFEGVDTTDDLILPKKKKKNDKHAKVDNDLLVNTTHKNETGATGDKKKSPLKKKKGKGKNNSTNLVLTDSTEVNTKGPFALKKSKKQTHLPLIEDVDVPDNKVHKKTKKKKTTQTISLEDPNGTEATGTLTMNQKKKKRKGRKAKLAENDRTNLDEPPVQRSKPNAAKFLFINLIKNTLRKKISVSKNKLKKKVLEKFCKMMGIEEKPELSKEYERSLMLTYGIEILEDTVQLKQ